MTNTLQLSHVVHSLCVASSACSNSSVPWTLFPTVIFFPTVTPWSTHFSSAQCDTCTACWKLHLLFSIVPWTLFRPWTLFQPWTHLRPWTPLSMDFGSNLCDTHTACCKLCLVFFYGTLTSFPTVIVVMHELVNCPMSHTHCMWQAPNAPFYFAMNSFLAMSSFHTLNPFSDSELRDTIITLEGLLRQFGRHIYVGVL